MKQLLSIILLLLPLHALTLKDAMNSRAVFYHPVIEGVRGQGDPLEFLPLGLKNDRDFYYLMMHAGGCGSEADLAEVRLYKQDLLTDSVSHIDSFIVYFYYGKPEPRESAPSINAENLEKCDTIFKEVMPLAPEHFIKSLHTITGLNRLYNFRFKWKKRKIAGDTITLALRTEDINGGKGGVLVNIEARSQKYGKKSVASYVDKHITHCNPGGMIHFNGSRRLIVVLDET